MNFSELPDPATPWWMWFVIFWGALFVLWLIFGPSTPAKLRARSKRKS